MISRPILTPLPESPTKSRYDPPEERENMFSMCSVLDEDNSCELSARRFGNKFLGGLEVSGAEHQEINSFDDSNDFIGKAQQVHGINKTTKRNKHIKQKSPQPDSRQF